MYYFSNWVLRYAVAEILQLVYAHKNAASVHIGVNFYKAAGLEPPTFQTPRLSGFSPPPLFCHMQVATPIMNLSSVVYRTIK